MQPYPTLYSLLAQHRRPGTMLWQALCSVIRYRSYLKREIWVEKGQVPDRICLLQSGAALAYDHYQDQRQLVRIWKEQELLLQAESGLAGHPSSVQILFAMDTTVLELSYVDLVALRRQYEEMQRYMDAFVADELQYLLDHMHWLKQHGAAQRIRDFRERYPGLDRILPEDDKASYLGMTRRWYNQNK